ncbi:hypothetical protein [Muribaculum intestinale]|uniref:hypothetical protein n=1 Tax=Muribaculum intestinale TaxID=1796646 RepID=UPI0025A96FCC|nr:hypothetical protein [Muribaculum intestinale]
MFNKRVLYTFVMICSLCIFFSCNNHNSGSKATNAKVSFTDESFRIESDSTNSFEINVSLNNKIFYNKTVKGQQIVSCIDLLKEPKDKYYDIAYLLATNKGHLQIGIKVSSVTDTIVSFWHDVSEIETINATLLSGNCAPFYGSFTQDNEEGDIIKWLYRNHYNNVSDSTIHNIRLYLQDLNSSSYKEYVTNHAIPVVSSFKGMDFSISSDMKADYYYLFACKDDREIEYFVEDMISLKFESANESVNQPFSCYRLPSTNGLACIMLIGIDSNWTYRIAPIGVVSIDNIYPVFGSNNQQNVIDNLLFKNHQIKIRPNTKVPAIEGSVNIGWGHFQGRGDYLNVPYTIKWIGDIKELRIYTSKSETYETISLERQISPVHISLSTLLDNAGDNYIKVDAIDYIGNTTTSNINIATKEIKDEKPSVNINNNIYN